MSGQHRRRLLRVVGPGLLVAATGVGAGDLSTAAFAGSHLGISVLWAVVLGSLMKFALNEGLARWQLTTGTTFLEGAVGRISPVVGWVFLPYLLLWSFFVGAALMSACGVTLHAMFPVFEDASTAKRVFGAAASLVGLALILAGGFSVFEKFMSVSVGVMFLVVATSAALLWPGWDPLLGALFNPQLTLSDPRTLTWTVALIGGIGGTVTILCYGYWIREEGRTEARDVPLTRLDLASGYLVTGLFGAAMLIIGSTVEIDGKGATLVVKLADQLESALGLGAVGRWAFLVGAFGAVFSSLLGVWQAVPYLFADLARLLQGRAESAQARAVDTRSLPYRAYLFALAIVPAAGLWVNFRDMQKLYAVVGASFMPAVALLLLSMNGRRRWMGAQRNGIVATAALLATLAFFCYAALSKWFL